MVKIEKLDDFGRGICYIDGKVTFVLNAVVGDECEVKITSNHKKYNEGVIEKLLVPSKDRVEPKCPYFNECGGCVLQNISYSNTMDYKKEKVKNAFWKRKIEVNPKVIENKSPFGYRNKITLKVIDGVLGYFSSKSHSIVRVDKCLIASDVLNKVIGIVSDFNILNGEVVIRCNKKDEVLLIINSNDLINVDINRLLMEVALVGVVLNGEVIYGVNYLCEDILGITYKYEYDSFFQVNPYVFEEILKVVTSNVKKIDKVIDLYCGVGSIGLQLAKSCKETIGVEIVESSIRSAKYNCKLNKINNASFVLNDASKEVLNLPSGFNVLVVDPPRSGLSKLVVDTIMNNNYEKIIYVSCDLHTLIRDVEAMMKNYEIQDLYVADMFSYTYHTECVCVLNRR